MTFDVKKPKFMVYVIDDAWSKQMFLDVARLFNSYNINVIILSFISAGGSGLAIAGAEEFQAYDAVGNWTSFSAADRAEIKRAFNGVIIASVGGAANRYIPSQDKAQSVSQALWAFARDNQLDGLDLDVEVSGAVSDLIYFGVELGKAKPVGSYYSLVPQG